MSLAKIRRDQITSLPLTAELSAEVTARIDGKLDIAQPASAGKYLRVESDGRIGFVTVIGDGSGSGQSILGSDGENVRTEITDNRISAILKNGTVRKDQLTTSLQTEIDNKLNKNLGAENDGKYLKIDSTGNIVYEIIDLGALTDVAANSVNYTPTGDITSTNVQGALDELIRNANNLDTTVSTLQTTVGTVENNLTTLTGQVAAIVIPDLTNYLTTNGGTVNQLSIGNEIENSPVVTEKYINDNLSEDGLIYDKIEELISASDNTEATQELISSYISQQVNEPTSVIKTSIESVITLATNQDGIINNYINSQTADGGSIKNAIDNSVNDIITTALTAPSGTIYTYVNTATKWINPADAEDEFDRVAFKSGVASSIDSALISINQSIDFFNGLIPDNATIEGAKLALASDLTELETNLNNQIAIEINKSITEDDTLTPEENETGSIALFVNNKIATVNSAITNTNNRLNTNGDIANKIAALENYIPNEVKEEGQELATEDYVNAMVQEMSANKVDYDATGAAFPTKTVLDSATTFYHNGAEYSPNSHDYAIVVADESLNEGDRFKDGQVKYELEYDEATDTATWSFLYGINEKATGIYYEKPTSGIPEEDLSQEVQNKLNNSTSNGMVITADDTTAGITGVTSVVIAETETQAAAYRTAHPDILVIVRGTFEALKDLAEKLESI